MAFNMMPMEPFDAASTANTAQRWKKWLNNFDLFVTAAAITDDKQKRATLLYSAGKGVQEIFATLDSTTTYKDAVDKLTAHFTPCANIPYSRHVFRETSQQSSETTLMFVTRLRELAVDCDFGSDIDGQIRDQVIERCVDKSLRVKYLTETNITLSKILKMSQAYETAHRHAEQYENNTNVNFAQSKRVDRSQLKCFNCGSKGHFASNCRSRTKVNQKSNKSSRQPESEEARSSYNSGPNRHSSKRHKVRCVDDENVDVEESEVEHSSDEYCYAISNSSQKIIVMVNDQPVSMIIDSGASCNLITPEIADNLIRHGAKRVSKETKIWPYGSPPIVSTYYLDATVNFREVQTRAKLLVVDSNASSLMGKSTAEELGVLKIMVNALSNDELFSAYPNVVNKKLGKLKDCEVKLHIDRTVPPVANKHYRIPFHLRDKVEEELQRLLRNDIIEEAHGPTEWLSSIVVVPKSNSQDVRICVDMRKPNQAIVRTRHITPTLDELIPVMNNAKIFSKIDLRNGYHQLLLHPESRYITTFSTHVGLFRYKRLAFGINSASEIFQHVIWNLIHDIPGARNISDDIIIFGENQRAHDKAVHAVLKRLNDNGLTINVPKCKFSTNEIDFFGFKFSDKGLSADPKKVEALKAFKSPEDAKALRSFIGMATYSSRFIQNYSVITAPLRELLKKEVKWNWTEKCEEAFQDVKKQLSGDTVMAFYDPKKKPTVVVDGSPVGLGAILLQDNKPVAYASRSLTDAETRYSQIEREALAVVFGCEHFRMYLAGCMFTIVTDHKPLLSIWKKVKPPLRIERWGLRLLPFKFDMVYQKGEKNIADYLSRNPSTMNSDARTLADEYVNFIANQSKPAAISMESLVKATEEDKLLQDVASLIKSNQWKQVHNNPKLQPYKNIHDELTIANNGILLRNARVIIPEKLQDQVITIAHEGHQGITKTKSLMRSKLWFPKMDDMVERYVNSCHECAMNTNTNNQVPLSMSELPGGPWMNISMDFCGPIPSGEYLFVIVDEYSRFPVVEIVNNLSAEKIIPVVDKVFSTFSYPVQVKTDNGTPFQSQQWSDFCEFNNIHHRSITPLWPKGNAQAENFNKPMLKAVRAAHHVRQSWKQALHTFLRMYRCTPHCTTSFSPHELLFTRPPRTKLPQIEKPDVNLDKVNQHDAKRKDIMKQYADTKNHAKPCDIVVGDKVYMKHKKINKWSTPYSSTIYNVVSIKGSMVTVCADDERDYKTRNVSFFKKVQTYTCRVVPKQQPPPPNNPAPIDQPQRPQRIKKPSVLLKDYVC